MKTELLIVSNEQYGYHIDSYKYCQYLKDKYELNDEEVYIKVEKVNK